MPSFLLVLLLSIGSVQAPATLRIFGAVPHPLTITAVELTAMSRVKVTASAHDQTGIYEGVTIREILTLAGVPAGENLRGAELAKTVIVTGADSYRAAFGVAEFDAAFTDRLSILADRKDGAALTGNAAPFQLIVTG